jgi:two-component system, OmpR family, sensor histidine kinase SenX3
MWRRAKADQAQGQRELPLLLVNVLNQLDGASLVVAPGEVAIFNNPRPNNWEFCVTGGYKVKSCSHLFA